MLAIRWNGVAGTWHRCGSSHAKTFCRMKGFNRTCERRKVNVNRIGIKLYNNGAEGLDPDLMGVIHASNQLS